MSNTSFRRDLTDPQTIEDFVKVVQSLDRLRLLLVLTVADIRAVGPKVWNGWKGELLRELYYRAEEVISGGHGEAIAKQQRVQSITDALREGLGNWNSRSVDVHIARLITPYWLAFDTETHLSHAELMRRAEDDGDSDLSFAVETRADHFRDVTEVTVFTPDERGVFARLAGAIAIAGANIVDARIFTTQDGMALDTFWVQDERAGAFDDERRLVRLKTLLRQIADGSLDLDGEVARRRHDWQHTMTLPVAPRVLIDNNASTKHTLIEITARDRLGLLYDLAQALTDLGLSIVTARVATFGERAVDAFYLRNSFGLKITSEAQLAKIRKRLIEVTDEAETATFAGAAE
jgi:[protein-PII] uridylyltransferase